MKLARILCPSPVAHDPLHLSERSVDPPLFELISAARFSLRVPTSRLVRR